MTTREEVAAALNGIEPSTKAQLQSQLDKGVDPEMVMDAAKANGGGGIPDNYGQVGSWAGVPIVVDKNLPRKALNAVSGGATEAIGQAVAGAPAQAAAENKSAITQGSVPPEEWAKLQAEANPMVPGAAGGMATENSTQHQSSSGTSGKDPRAVAKALEGEAQADEYAKAGMQGQVAADTDQYQRLQGVQQNEMQAIQTFKKDQDALQEKYNHERDLQMQRMGQIQKAMDAVPNAPRTIHQWLEKSGTGDKIRFGLAAAFSVLGGAASKDGGQGAENFLKIVQGNIDRNVQKEADNYSLLGKRYAMADSVYGHLRQNLNDDQEALNLTKAMYYQAAINATKQIALQYKMDLQSPQVDQFMEHLQREHDALVLQTASNIQQQTTTAVGAKQVPVKGAGSKEFDEQLGKFGEEIEKRGGNVGERAIGLYTQAIGEMKKLGYDKDSQFWTAYTTLLQDPSKVAVTLATLPADKAKVLQLLMEAGNEQLLGEAGKTVSANELARQVMAKGGYSISSLENVIKIAQQKRDQIANAVAGTYGGAGNQVGKAYWARKRIAELEGEHRGIAATPRVPIDQSDVRNSPR